MKITQNDLAELKALLAPIAPKLEAYRAANPTFSETRIQWDAFWAIPSAQRTPWVDRVCRYANDTHINTALRSCLSATVNA